MNKNYFDKVDTREKAYWLGFILADGCVIWNENQGNYCLSIGLQRRDEKLLSELEHDLGGTRKPSIYEKTQSSRLVWYSKHLAQTLINRGIVPRKSSINIKCPKIRQNLISHFWRGVFDGDGMITLNKPASEYRFSLAGSPFVLESFMGWYGEFGVRR